MSIIIPMRNSCGAILYSYDTKGNLGIILGMERNHWLPFKGCHEDNETMEETAIREIYEETCKLVSLKKIDLTHKFSSKRKHYHIGLCQVPYDIINKFSVARAKETEKKYLEKTSIKFFPFNKLSYMNGIHNITRVSINYFWDDLADLNRKYVPRRRTKWPNKNYYYANSSYPWNRSKVIRSPLNRA